jgi:hypothetical protein
MGDNLAQSPGDRTGERAMAALGAAEWLYLAATPTFSIMALLTALGGNPIEGLCTSGRGIPTGMVTMYVLMAVFHSRPWLNLISGKLIQRSEQ